MTNNDPQFYRRNLPHIQPLEGTFFVTFSLEGAITREMWASHRDSYEIALRKARLDFPHREKYLRKARAIHRAYFGKYDALLDGATAGPRWLEQPAVARIVRDSLRYQEGRAWRLIAWCIMPNHVHLVADNLQKPLFRIMQQSKTFTAREANKLLVRTGQPFWRREGFDHLIRDDWSLSDKVSYTLQNPVKAGLCQCWDEWPWTGLHADFKECMP